MVGQNLKYVHRGNVTRRAGEQKQTEHMIMRTKETRIIMSSVCSLTSSIDMLGHNLLRHSGSLSSS